jgi:hypothetical protein
LLDFGLVRRRSAGCRRGRALEDGQPALDLAETPCQLFDPRAEI